MNNVEEIFENLRGLPCWNVEWDADLNLSMNFGQPFLDIDEPLPVSFDRELSRQHFTHKRTVTVKGEWYLWVMSGYWKISVHNFEPVSYSTEYTQKSKVLYQLDGQKIVKTTITPKSLTTTWKFDLEGILTVRRKSKNDRDYIWMLHGPNGFTISALANGKFEGL